MSGVDTSILSNYFWKQADTNGNGQLDDPSEGSTVGLYGTAGVLNSATSKSIVTQDTFQRTLSVAANPPVGNLAPLTSDIVAMNNIMNAQNAAEQKAIAPTPAQTDAANTAYDKARNVTLGISAGVGGLALAGAIALAVHGTALVGLAAAGAFIFAPIGLFLVGLILAFAVFAPGAEHGSLNDSIAQNKAAYEANPTVKGQNRQASMQAVQKLASDMATTPAAWLSPTPPAPAPVAGQKPGVSVATPAQN